MKHYPLKRIFHMSAHDAEQTVEGEYQSRKDSPSTIQWHFPLGQWPLFCCITSDLAAKIEKILSLELQISQLWNRLPGAARTHYLFNLLLAEVVATNEIEGIHSTRREVAEALDNTSGTQYKRFHEFSQLYFRLANDERIEFPTTLTEIRQQYDQLLGDEIAAEDELDGELFRAATVTITDGQQQVHRGVESEAAIHQLLNEFLATVNSAEDNRLIRILASHFMFEFVHPFYDGNGRMGRFLLSVALREALSTATALTISRQLAEDKAKYYKAFTTTEDPMNRGEVTFFVEAMADVILNAQQYLLEELQMKSYQCERLEQRIAELSNSPERVLPVSLTGNEIGTLYVLAQVRLFGPEYGIKLEHVADTVGKEKRTARKYLAELEAAGLAMPTSRRPLRFQLAPAGLDLLGLEPADHESASGIYF
ncbi:Fic family protein [Corynebacterium amycolatum]|nr:Fic family protein [Corynebacterium amycolatum]MBU5624887.1 Fic family protein [Corynebacterium amycolatum]